MMKENVYIVSDESKECIIIDCGCQTEEECKLLSTYIEGNGLEPKRLICTHLHLDHIFGNKYVMDRYGLRAEACAADHLLYDLMHYQTVAFGIDDSTLDIPEPEYTLEEDKKIEFGATEMVVIATPGHSPGGLSFYCGKEKILFSGDSLMRESIGATNLPGSRKAKLLKSIKEKLFALPDDTQVFSGHGPVTTIGWEKENNAFLKG